MKAEKQWIFLALVVVASMAITVYVAESYTAERAVINVTAYPQPAEVGYAIIRLDSTLPLENVFVVLPDRQALFTHSENNSYYFEYFVSPQDEIGLKQITFTATDTNGNQIHDESQGFYVGYNARGTEFNGVVFYAYHWDPSYKALELVYKEKINFFFENTPTPNEGNQEVINSFVPLITTLASKGIEVVTYGVEVEGGEWLSCRDTEENTITVGGCKALLGESSIILKYPRYPTTQVFVSNSTIEIQPKRGETKKAINAMLELLEYVPPFMITMGGSPATEGNSTTGDNSTQ